EKRDGQKRAAVDADVSLVPAGSGVAPGRFGPRGRVGADVDNGALATAFASEDRSEVIPRGGAFALPFGKLQVEFDPAALRAGDRELYQFVPAEALRVEGFEMRYRWPGLGTPLAASTRPIDPSQPSHGMVAPRL